MSKEYLEALDYVWYNYYTEEELSEDEINEFVKHLKIVETALKRLETIDNAEPSEALKELNILQNALDKYLKTPLTEYVNLFDCINTIKQYILKAQEPKKYLTWEELEFKEETTYENVKMGEHIYELKYWKYKDSYKDFMGNDIYYYEKFVYLRGHQIECTELFNDLHLEKVEK